MSKKKLDKYQQGGEPQYQGELPIKRNNISKLISGFLNKVRPIVGESAATISEALYNAVPFEDLRSIVAEESGADISGIKDMYEQVLSEYSTYLNTPPAKNTKVAKVLINGEEKTALLDPKTKSVLNVFQQGGKPNPNQLYGDAGDYLSNIMGGINSNPLFNTKTNPAAKTRDQLVKEMGLYYKTGGSFLYKNRWIDPKTGQEYFAEDLDKMVGQSNTDAISSTKAFNESLPLAKQLSALFDIQQKGNEEIENAKPILQDFQPLAASFAPRGFAQQGGAADGQGQTKVMPSTDAIIGGLPKEMSADDVAMVAKNAAKEQIRATREKLNEAYETLLEDAETKLRQKLALKGLDEETADSFIEDLYQNNFPVFDEYLPESFSPIRKSTIEDVKAKFDIFLPDLKDEVENIYNIEKGLKERFTDLSRKELELEMGVESKTTDRKPKREGFKYFQQGGEPVNQLQQIMGYKDSSHFRNMSSQDFYTDTLTMSGVSKPLLAIANNGQTKIMKPNSGLYNFPGATKITEIPLAQEGGSASTAGCKPKLNNNDEITKLLGMNRYKIMPNLIATMQQGGIIKLKSDEGDPYQYEFDQTTGDYYTITPQGKRIKLKKGSAAEQEVARRSQWQINKGSYQNKYSSGFIDTDSYRYLIPNDNTVPPDSVDSYGTVDGHGDVFMREKIGVKKGGVRILPLNESKAAKIRMQKEYGRQAIDPINAYVPIRDLKDSFKYNPVTGDIIEETEEWDDTLGKPVKVRKKVRGDAYDRMRDVIRKRGTAVGLVPAEDEYTKREGSFFGRLYNDFLFQSGGSPTYKIENDLDLINSYNNVPSSVTVFNPLDYRRKYMNGGRVMQNYMPVGNGKTKVESYIPLEAMLPIQTEKKELIVLPTMDLVKVNASKRHSQMSEDQVTDVVPENSYILSQFGKVDIYKSEADQAIVEVQNKPYNIYGANPEPKTKSLGDYMSKKKMKPADLGRTLLNKYKQMNNPGDPFTEQTNAANKYTLSKYLEVLIGLSEMDKARKGLNDDNSVAPQMFAKDGGRVLRTGYNVPKAQAGAIIGGASALISGIGSLFTNAKNRKLLQQNTAATLFDINNLYKQQTGLENTALAANLMGFAAQNPEIKPVLENTNFLDATQRFIPQQQTDYLMGRALANRPDVTGMDPRLANGITGRYYAQALDSQSNFALQAAQARIGFLNNYLQQKQAAENRNVASRTNAFNATTANMNSLLAGSAGAISGSMTNGQNLLTNKLNATMAARGQQTSGLIALNNQLLQGLTNSAALGLQAYNSIQNNNSQDPNKPVPQNQLCQPPIQGCPQGSFWSYVQCRCI